MAQLTDEVEGASDEDGVFGSSFRECGIQGRFGVVDYGDVCELSGAHGARIVWLREDSFADEREKQAGDFIYGFVAHGAVNQNDSASRKMLFQKVGEFTRCAGIVRPVEINVRVRLEFFEAPGPLGFGNAM